MVMGIIKGKRGVFYTVTALLLIAVFLFSFISITKYKYSTKAFVVETRVNTVNDFIKDVERDIQRAVYITSYRAILSMTGVITTNQSYITDIDGKFSELFFNGTYDGNMLTFMTNNSFTDWEQKIELQAQRLAINIEMKNKTTTIGQDDPWHIKTGLNFTLEIGDIKGTANFTKDYYVTADVPIDYFEDPTYRLNTNGLIIRSVEIANNTDFTDGADVTNLKIHVNETRYVAFEGAPSYLKRMQGDLTADVNGIESLVDVDQLILQGLNVTGKSVVDYVYFGSSDPTKYTVTNMPSWFKLDNETAGNTSHLELYEVEGLV